MYMKSLKDYDGLYEGVIESLLVSLFTLGVIKEKRQLADGYFNFVFKTSETEDKFDTGMYSQKDVNDVLEEFAWNDSFSSSIKMERDEFVNLNLVNQVTSLVNHYGYEEFFGARYYGTFVIKR